MAKQEPKKFLSWEGSEDLALELARMVRRSRRKFDYFMVVVRGGMCPACILTQQLNQKKVLAACVSNYRKGDRRRKRPVIVMEFPDELVLEGKKILVIDDVWDTGRSLKLIVTKIERAGGKAFVAVLHYKPSKSLVKGRPHYFVSKTDAWIVYPWERESRRGRNGGTTARKTA